jgi:hypothetical protein
VTEAPRGRVPTPTPLVTNVKGNHQTFGNDFVIESGRVELWSVGPSCYGSPMTDNEPTTAPYDPTYDADNPYIIEVPERFVDDSDPEAELTWETLDATLDFYNEMAARAALDTLGGF